jgi:hypothetical protein
MKRLIARFQAFKQFFDICFNRKRRNTQILRYIRSLTGGKASDIATTIFVGGIATGKRALLTRFREKDKTMNEEKALLAPEETILRLFAKALSARAGVEIAKPEDIAAKVVPGHMGHDGSYTGEQIRLSWKNAAGEVLYDTEDAIGLVREALDTPDGPEVGVNFVSKRDNESEGSKFGGAYLAPEKGFPVEKLAVIVLNALKPELG